MMGSCNKKIICVRSLHFNLVANDKGSQNACSKYQPQTNWTWQFFREDNVAVFARRLCFRRNRFGPW